MCAMQPTPPPVPRRNAGRRFLFVVLLLILSFLGGFGPQWWKARQLGAEVRTMDMQIRLAGAHRLLGVASHEAQRNNYASAGEAAAQFFEQCTALARTEPWESEPRTRVALLAYAAQRDEIMALLSAGDPAVRERLAGMYLAMDGVLGRRTE